MFFCFFFFEIINFVVPELRLFLWIPSTAASAFNTNGIKTILPNGLVTLFINDKPVFINNQEVYQKSIL